MGEHHAVRGAIHGFETETGPLRLEQEHVFLVLLIVARLLPQVEVEDVGRDDFLIATHPILLPDHRHQLVVNVSSSRIPESAARSQAEMREEILRLADQPMVATLCLLQKVQMLLQLLLAREGDRVDPLQAVIGHLS